MESVIEFARDGGLVLGICNGFQVLCEARLLPGALLPNANLRFTFRQVELEVVARRHARSRAAARRSSALEHPRQALLGALLRRRAARSTRLERSRPGRAALRPRAELQRLARATSPACATRRGNVFGLMPHPEHAVDELTGGSTDGLRIFESMRLAVEGARV